MSKPDDSTILLALRSVQDPGLAESIVDLGWITRVRVRAKRVIVEVTPPAPAYPHADVVTGIRQTISELPGVGEVDVHLVWEPAWTPVRMVGHLRTALGLAEQAPPNPSSSPVHAASRLLGRLLRPR